MPSTAQAIGKRTRAELQSLLDARTNADGSARPGFARNVQILKQAIAGKAAAEKNPK